MYKKLITNLFTGLGAIALFSVLPKNGNAQQEFKPFENLFTAPKSYVVTHTNTPPVIDGDVNDAVWQQTPWTDDFRDIEGDLKPNPPLRTKVKMLWDDSCLYIAAQIYDPAVWATLKHHDDIIYRDNDFEVFIDPNKTGHQYFEIECNALNTIFDLFLNKPYRNNGNAMIGWNAEGLRSAVKIQGTLNNPSDTDQGWTMEMVVPFKSISLGDNVQIPHDGTLWRINFSRVEWDTKVVDGKYIKLKDSTGRNLKEHNWVWSPQGVINMHFPERWGYLQFSKGNTNNTVFTLPYSEQQKRYLWLLYYHQKQWQQEHGTYATSIKKFGLKSKMNIGDKINILQMEATAHQFVAFITDKTDNTTWSINQEGLIGKIKSPSNE
ncbi:carbohydrate binding protein with CBM9 domain [Mucilaginibacter frigoritolerans]|uniref:Carbohydrate binding protein with CBM9 domain n=1 Tax=Mucilaginibacter frigoritolerans TaxID=652788 RepID=A0A562UGQ3_9SPHI|nr:carbohydrate-binding family 9-like protein [Mucilaginibacter frigoritolerans]TWJ04567.1 carbohydrate binding protein with CBM9 domain [Mucilaginibacter frigoritolerans]